MLYKSQALQAPNERKKERKVRGKKKAVVMKTSETEHTPEYKCLKIEINIFKNHPVIQEFF